MITKLDFEPLLNLFLMSTDNYKVELFEKIDEAHKKGLGFRHIQKLEQEVEQLLGFARSGLQHTAQTTRH